MTVCEPCLRHSHLIAHLAPRIAGMLGRRSRPSALLELDEDALIDEVCTPPRAHSARDFLRRFDADRALEALAETGIAAVCRHAAQYPSGLAQLSDPPRVLYCTGSAARLAELAARPAATLVGTRRASPYGLETARELGRELSAAGVTVVSGLALGIDAAAHRGALDGRGEPIAVLACGADVAYPPSHGQLYRRIRELGLVVAELPPGSPAFRWSFPARNRIMAALGAITVVVEAADPSGSLITAGFAGDLGRTVGAVPGKVNSRVAAGSNRLLREGAATIRGTVDVLDELFGAGNGASLIPRDPLPVLGPSLKAVLDGVEAGESVGEIVARTGMRAGSVRAALGQLELEGLVVAGALGWYERVVRS